MKPTMNLDEKLDYASIAIGESSWSFDDLEAKLKFNIIYSENYVSASKKIGDTEISAISFYSDHEDNAILAKQRSLLEAAAIIGRDFT